MRLANVLCVRRVLCVLWVVAIAACGKTNVDPRPAETIAPTPVAAAPAEAPEVATPPNVTIKLENGHVALIESSGAVRWRVPLTGYLGSVRAPDRFIDGDRVFVVADHRLVALDAKDGHRVWDAPGPADRLHAHAGLILMTDCSSPSAMEKPRFVVARRVTDGGEAFRVEIPKNVDPNAIFHIGSTFFVGDARSTTAIGVDGKKRFGLEEGLIVAHAVDDDWLLATTKRIVRLGANGEVRWERPVLKETFVGSGGVVAIDKDEIVLFGYSAISDSGVELVRLRLRDGKERWRSYAKPAGVGHSEYEHKADVTLKGGILSVASRGSYASFDETIALDSGASLSRTVTKR